MSELRTYDVARVCRLPAYVDAPSATAPGLGDHGTVVEVLHAPGLADRLLVESCDSRGHTRWLAEFPRAALAAAPFAPCEPLTFAAMASGNRSLNLGRDVSWAAFPDYARSVARRLGAGIIDGAEDPAERLVTLSLDGARFWLAWEAHAACVSLDPCDADAGARMHSLREILLASRGPVDAMFRLRDEPGELPRLDSGVSELDFFLRDELGTGGAVDDDSLTLELARQLHDVRLGRVPSVMNGSDAMFITIEPAGVRLEYAFPGAPRPGALVSLHSFADVFARWFDHANPTLGAAVHRIVWPPAARL